jgi:hypothetical protein
LCYPSRVTIRLDEAGKWLLSESGRDLAADLGGSLEKTMWTFYLTDEFATLIGMAKKPSRRAQKAPPHKLRTFADWKRAFDGKIGNEAKTAFDKWIKKEESYRSASMTHAEDVLKSIRGESTNICKLPPPQNARAHVLQRLYRESVPNIKERTDLENKDKRFLKQMEELADSADELVTKLSKRGATSLKTQDGCFEVPLYPLLLSCQELSDLIRVISQLIERKHVYPIDIADCCMSLVVELENHCGASQRECHDLIRIALLAHGCDQDQVERFFDPANVGRGTIRGKKESLQKKLRESVGMLSKYVGKS